MDIQIHDIYYVKQNTVQATGDGGGTPCIPNLGIM